MKINFKTVLSYVIAIILPLAVGALSALLTRGQMDIYSTLSTPPLSPPAILFPIVWTILYILMGVSSAIIWNKREKCPECAKTCLIYYIISLVLNFFWSIIFFNMRLFVLAFIWLVIMLYFIIRTTICYYGISKPAAFLQIPYIIWTAFAGYLTLSIAIMN